MAERWLAMHASTNSRFTRASQDTHASLPPEAEEPHRTPPSVRRPVGRSSHLDGISMEMSPGRSERAFRTGNERLYEAYNDLHALAQDFEKPFDAPAILVVGHQTDGKSGGCWRGMGAVSEVIWVQGSTVNAIKDLLTIGSMRQFL